MNKGEELLKLLKLTGKTVSTAESCTGGMIGAYLTDIAGISEYYGYGVVTYSNDAKQKLIGVNADNLKNHGAVSREVALDMSRGIMNVSGANIGVSSTGIAGPGGGTPEKPVGLVYISLCTDDGYHIYKQLNLKGDRLSVRQQTVEQVTDMIIDYLKKEIS